MNPDVLKRLEDRGIFVKGIGSHRVVCPQCEGGSKREASLTVTVNHDSAVWKCFRGSCEWKGGFGGRANGYHHDRDAKREAQERVAQQSLEKWEAARYAPDSHQYLTKKRISAHNLKVDNIGRLLVPAQDAEGKLWSLQTIAPNGKKLFPKDGRVKGCFHRLGDSEPGQTGLVIAEGFATAATIRYAANSLPVFIAFDCNNLEPVARTLRALYPDAPIVIAADDDHATEGNPGLTKAQAAADLIGAAVAIPEFVGARGEKDSDFNDMVAQGGRNPGERRKLSDQVNQIIWQALESAPEPRQPPPQPEREQRPRRVLNLADYRATRFTGPPPPIKWLVQHSIPLGVPVLLAAMGGVGKSFLTLQLCHLVATPPIENPGTTNEQIHNLSTYTRPILGGTVVEHGTAVLITAEDSDDVIHRRLAVVDPEGRRTDDLIVIGLPSAGGPLTFFTSDREGVRATDEWYMVLEQLRAIPDLKLVVIDPIAAFCQVSLDADSAACQFVMSAFSQLAAETGATVLLCHHMRKSVNGKPPTTPAEAREQIKGVSQIVDGARLAYAIWPVEEKEGLKVCDDLAILPREANRVFKGGIVKTNERGGNISTYVRSPDGLLVDRTSDLHNARPSKDIYLDLLVEDIAFYAEDRMPLQKTGGSGVHEQYECLHPDIRDLARDYLRGLVQELLDAGRVVKCRAKGSSNAVWLDVPGGPYTQVDGECEIRTGTRTNRHSDGS
jgi:hypothetical protein